MQTDFVLDALEQALYDRQPQANSSLTHHSDRGSQYVSIRYSERLAEAGIEPSVGSKGDSYDNALAETINGLYKAELIHRRAPWTTRKSVEMATLEWVAWFNHQRLLQPIGYIPPAEAEANYYRQLTEQTMSVWLQPPGLHETRGGSAADPSHRRVCKHSSWSTLGRQGTLSIAEDKPPASPFAPALAEVATTDFRADSLADSAHFDQLSRETAPGITGSTLDAQQPPPQPSPSRRGSSLPAGVRPLFPGLANSPS